MSTVDGAVAAGGRAGLFASACVRICDGGPGGPVVGTGFLVGPDLVATCAHVVAEALGGRADAAEPPPGMVALDFAILGEEPGSRTARITRWSPIAPDGRGDVALLRLDEPAPPGALMPPLRGGDGSRWDHRFRIFGFPEGQDDGVWTTGRIRAVQGTGWLQLQGTPGDHPVEGGFSGSPVWDDETGAVIGMTVAVDRVTGVTTAYVVPAADVLGLDPELLPCPYRGAEPFDEEHAEVFFGRDRELERLRRALDDGPVVAVAGPSGAGKSSLVRAGLVPGLRRAGVPVAAVAPDPPEDVLVALAAAVQLLATPGTAPARLELDATRIGGALAGAATRAGGVTELAAALSGSDRVVLLLDQFEELIEIAPERARDVLDVLAALVGAPGADRLRVLLTVRASALEEVLTPDTAALLGSGTVLVGPLDPPRLRETVERPAAVAPGLRFADGLVDRILADADPGPGQLPLVQSLLVQLWHRRDGGTLTWAAYETAGGVAGALARHADRAAGAVAVGPAADRELDALLVRLVAVGRDGVPIRRAVRYRDLPGGQRALVAPLAAHRLVTLSGQGDAAVVETAHQSLATHWPRLRRLVEHDRDFLTWRTELDAARQRWLAAERDDDALLRGSALGAAQRWHDRRADLTGEESDYLDRSRDRRRREVRRRRIGAGALAVAVAVAVTLTVVAVQGSVAERARATAAALAAESGARAAADPALAAELAATAWATDPDEPGARAALVDRYVETTGVDGYVAPAGSGRGAASVSAAGSGAGAALLVVGADPAASGVDAVVSGVLGPHPQRRPLPADRYDGWHLSADGRHLALHRTDGGIELLDLTAPPDAAPVVLAGPGNAGVARFGPDGRTLAWADRAPDGPRVHRYDVGTRTVRTVPAPLGPEPVTVYPLARPEQVIVRAAGGPARLLDLGSGAELASVPADTRVHPADGRPYRLDCTPASADPGSVTRVTVREVGVDPPVRTIALDESRRDCDFLRVSAEGRWLLTAEPVAAGLQRWRAVELGTGRAVQFAVPQLEATSWNNPDTALGITLAPGADGSPVAFVAAGSAVLRAPTVPAPVERGTRYPVTGSDTVVTVVAEDATGRRDVVSRDASGRELARRPGLVGGAARWQVGEDLWLLDRDPRGWTATSYDPGTLREERVLRLPPVPTERLGVFTSVVADGDGRTTGVVGVAGGTLAAWDAAGTALGAPFPIAATPEDADRYRTSARVVGRPGHPGQALVGTAGDQMTLWDVPGRRELARFPIRPTDPVVVGDDRVVAAGGPGTMRVWDLAAVDAGSGPGEPSVLPLADGQQPDGFLADGRLVTKPGGAAPGRTLVHDLDRRAVVAALPAPPAGVVAHGRELSYDARLGNLPVTFSVDPERWVAGVCRVVPPEPSAAIRPLAPGAADPCP
ncbi:S1 family peptidase [Pseudonocardia sp. HH130630-07]|uniref:S1 family peptidase n=1 Tax=Pseudonocardia sp. HH130630-07 TaxID=1690815 RepID=UPI00081506C4|nr:serine protease [Pseudonocardia sp. HH130630-07]ANY08858.1 hypothetical protein AFB00_24275 [Pseudonocardia sp. HH130630-07]